MSALATLLHDRLRGSAVPVVLCGDRTLPAASLWVSATVLRRGLRDAGLEAGDVVVLAAGDPLVELSALVAGLGLGLAVHLPAAGTGDDDAVRLADRVGARLLLTTTARPDPWVACCALDGLTSGTPPVPRPRSGEPAAPSVVLHGPHGSTSTSHDDLRTAVAHRLETLDGPGWSTAAPRAETTACPRPVDVDTLVDLVAALARAHVLEYPAAPVTAPPTEGTG